MRAASDDMVQQFDDRSFALRRPPGKFKCTLNGWPRGFPTAPSGVDERLQRVRDRKVRILARGFLGGLQGAGPRAGVKVDGLVEPTQRLA